MSNLKNNIQNFGKFLSGMVMPNIGAFIAWGFITCFFIPDGWFPNEQLVSLVDPILKYLLPVLIGYTGGGVVAGKRGSVMGAIATMGVIVGADIPMLIGGMIMGPIGGLIIKFFDKAVDGKIPTGFEMLVNNFSIGILGMILAILGFYTIGPAIQTATQFIEQCVQIIVEKNILPLVSVFIEPAKVLFLNNAVNHGVLTPIGISQAEQAGKSIMFLLESNPGPGLGILLAYCLVGKGSSKQSAPGAVIIHFLGGIHEIYFPYILMKPLLIIAAILGGASGVFTFSLLNTGLVAAPSPGSVFAILALAPKGGLIPVIAGIFVATVVSLLISIPIIKKSKDDEDSLEKSKEKVKNLKNTNIINNADSINKQKIKNTITNIIFACDAGMGSSAMGASRFKERIKSLNQNISVTNTSVDSIPNDAQVVVTHKNLVDRVLKKNNNVEIVPISNFLKDPLLDELYHRISNQ
ncbi:PTS mannitol transporter subunit IICB [[Clostridium] colinum]|uniref:PTS mannitol transporter subunit IICB n=1 Tax=[Clostridium] colinum TaxID=36835 RepID=UPI0020245DDD|nr:PTS mannitol transporter subunit IICB [[Clostridium] colinum]